MFSSRSTSVVLFILLVCSISDAQPDLNHSLATEPTTEPTTAPTAAPTQIPTIGTNPPAPFPLGTLNPTKRPTPDPTTDPTTPQPTTPRPTTPAPVTARPTTPAPVTSEPTTASPTTAIGNLLAALKQQITAGIQQIVGMTIAELNAVVADNSVLIDSFAAMLTIVDQATDQDGAVTVIELLQVLDNVAEPQINAILLGFATVLDQQQQLVISEIKNFLSTENPLIRAAIQKTILQRQQAIQQSIVARQQAMAAAVENLKQTLIQIYNDGLATFAQELHRYKLGEFTDIGPDASGEISTDQLIAYASQMILMSDDDIRQLCLIADPEGRGKVNYAQFAEALSAQYLAKSIVTSLFENIYANVQSFVAEISSDENTTTSTTESAGDVMPDQDIVSQLNKVHGKDGNGSYFVMDALTVLVIVLVVFVFVMFMCMFNGVRCPKRKYTKTLEEASDGDSEDDQLIS